MSISRAVLAFVFIASSSSLIAQRLPETQRTDVPVKTVMLFSSGVGYFEHAGTVRGDGATELRFKTSQINDILKSLVLQDQDGGKVSSITYPSQDPLSKTLRSFQVDITQNPSLADLLNQLRGAHITLQSQAEKLSGVILGVEQRRKSVSNSEAVDVPVLNVLTGANIRAIELPSVSSLSLDDAALQDELTKALVALSQARDQDKKPVTINFTGTGDRRVRIGYVVETPIWKTSYRLLLDNKTSKIQGWAIVENQTESDWNGVSLSLVSGRPISFAMDLYQPLYLSRPVVTQELFSGLRPQVYDGGLAMSTQASATPLMPRGQTGTTSVPEARTKSAAENYNAPTTLGAGGRAGFANRPMNLDVVNVMDMSASVQSIASAAKMGELFQYTIPNVTLPRQKSAMLPIVTDSISIERVSIYNASVLQKNPLNGVRLKNTTGKHLLQGPVTVLDNDHYAGDARIDNVPPGQERLLSYGIDLQMAVDNTKNTQQVDVVTGKIVKGVLTIDRKIVSSQEYLAENKSDKDKVLVIEHPIRYGWKLADTQKPVETTTSLYRFQGTVPAKKATTLSVKEETVRSEVISILSTDATTFLTYSQSSDLPANVRAALIKAAALKQALVETERLANVNHREVESIAAEQSRIRENMKTVGQTNQYYQRLLAKLNEQESAIEKLQTQVVELNTKASTQRKELEAYLADLNIA